MKVPGIQARKRDRMAVLGREPSLGEPGAVPGLLGGLGGAQAIVVDEG